MAIKEITTEADYESALRRIEQLWGAPEGSALGDELEAIAARVEEYELRHYPLTGRREE